MKAAPMRTATAKAIERAAGRIRDALERNSTPSDADLKTAKVCRSCYGYGYYYLSDDAAGADERTTCKSCGGDGRAMAR
jgi:DnaJ-class molecular chaperone